MLLCDILQPIRKINNSETLIDNIFWIVVIPSSTSGNLTTAMFDHLPQFLIAPGIFLN